MRAFAMPLPEMRNRRVPGRAPRRTDNKVSHRVTSIILAAALAAVACAPLSRTAALPDAPRAWPEPPAPARIVYVRSFSRPQDLGITKGLFQRLGEFFVGRDDVRLVRPMAVVAWGDDLVFVADPGAKGVHRFDLAKGRHHLIRREGGAPLPSPVGLALGVHGEAYVTDSALGQVFVIRPGAKAAAALALAATLAQPTGIALDPATGRLYVVDTANHEIKIFTPDGALHATFGRRGTGDGEFNYPTMIWRDVGGRLFVADSLNFRTQMFDAAGRPLGKFGKLGDATGDLARPKGVATDRFGHVYVVDSMFHALQVFDTEGRLLLHIGSQGRAPGEFWLPTGVYVGAQDKIYVADTHNRRVQVFRYVGSEP